MNTYVTTDTKSHYVILDGLRGIAAIMVLAYHIFEAIAFAPISSTTPKQELYHGFMAVDFFFILSGFVMGYAYNARLRSGEMSFGNFVKRRIIRLHPMVVMGVLIGLVAFFIQGCTRWDGTKVATDTLLGCTLLALFCLPTPLGMDVRGNSEAFPVNGPHWSLFLEYIGSWLYGLFLYRASTRVLKVWVCLAACALLGFGIVMHENTIGYGWSSEPVNLLGGLIRISFGLPCGLLLARLFQKRKPFVLKGPVFLACACALVFLFLMPDLNGVSVFYQALCICLLFPIIVWFGARGAVEKKDEGFLNFLGRLSFPLYAVHYPVIYLYIHWMQVCDPAPGSILFWGAALIVFCICIALGTICLLCYDEPVRRWLSKK